VLDLTVTGGLLISRWEQSAALEFDLDGKCLWQVKGPGTTMNATAMRNGHLMVTHYYDRQVVQLDRAGRAVWQYQTAGYNPFLARQR
jgi:hypothetical protein